ncbi:hypothetical protein [Streptomyces microflavus]|uniref:hypothetical protein n=1 Tax=Streptomyces microflavus TaxID=1919 RepID=UPI0033C2497A
MRGQDAGELANLRGECFGEFGHCAPTALVDDVDDDAVLDHAGGRAVSVAGQGVLKGLEFLAESALNAFPGLVRVVDGRQAGVDGPGERDGRGRGPVAVVRGGDDELGQRDRDQAGGREALERGNGCLRTCVNDFGEVLVQLLDPPLGPARLPVRLSVTLPGVLPVGLTDPLCLDGLGEAPLEFGDGGADGGTQSPVRLIGRRRLARRLFRPLGEVDDPLLRLGRLDTLVVHLPCGVPLFAQRGPQSRQRGGEGAEGVTHGGESGPFGGQPQISGSLGELGGSPLGKFGRLDDLGGTPFVPGTGLAHGLGGGADERVCPGERRLVGDVCKLGVERASACRDRRGPSREILRLLAQRGEFNAERRDPGPARCFACALADVRGGGLGPRTGERTDPKAPVGCSPCRGSSPAVEADGGEQSGHRSLVQDSGPPIAVVHGGAQNVCQ